MRKPSAFKPVKFKAPKAAKPEWAKNPFEASGNHDLAIEAMRRGVCLAFRYHDSHRVVGVFTVGLTKAGRPAMSAWQVDGQSNELTLPDWGTFCFDECFNVSLSDRPSPPPPANYSKGAKQFIRIDAEF